MTTTQSRCLALIAERVDEPEATYIERVLNGTPNDVSTLYDQLREEG